jgi:glucose/arabinose dehydrogenase
VRCPVRLAFVCVLALGYIGCGGEATSPDVTPFGITISPAGSQTITSGTSTTLSANATNKSGGAITGQTIGWSSDDASVATVSPAGVVTGVHVGQTSIRASIGAISSTGVSVTVAPGAAATLAIRTQPAGAVSGGALATQPVVEIRDAAGNLTSSTAAVTAAIGSVSGTLGGTTTVTAVAGLATFTNLSLTGVGARTIVFSGPSVASATSASIDVTAAAALTIAKYAQTAAQSSARLVRDPISGRLFVMQLDGTILRLVPNTSGGGASVEQVYSAAVTGMASVEGMAFGPDGAIYLVGDQLVDQSFIATIRRGVRTTATSDTRVWSNVAHTAPIPAGGGSYDHRFNGIAVSADSKTLYVNSGARTDHGEIESNGGRFPGLRDVPLTALVLKLPADGSDILLQNDDAALRAGGYVFARGVRNTFDLALNAAGELFGGDNSGDRDDNDELNWLQQDHHYGFPWRMGTNDTPQQFPGYDPLTDKLINRVAYTNSATLFTNDPTYPARPSSAFTDPVVNAGPDANSVRNASTGVASKGTIATFTSHTSPLGLVFDVRNELPAPFRGGAFILAFTPGSTDGNPTQQGPFLDPSQALIQLVLTRSGDSYQTTARRFVCGFNEPVDAEIMNGKLYVLEIATGTIWEISLPTGSEAARTDCPNVTGA